MSDRSIVFAGINPKSSQARFELVGQALSLSRRSSAIYYLKSAANASAADALGSAAAVDDANAFGAFMLSGESRVTQLPERSARRVLKQLTDEGLLASSTPKGPVSLRFPSDTLETLFPRLYA